MCGIIGIISKQEKNVFPELLDALHSMKHRGNDSFGVCVENSFIKKNSLKEFQKNFLQGFKGLAENRLKIVGNGLPPYTDCFKKIVLVHNGEIYNYSNILKKNHCFSSSTDSEIIAHFLEEQLKNNNVLTAVKNFFKIARGSFAVIFSYKNKLFAFRDLIGLKPLWFGENNSFIAVCSEVRPLKKLNIQFPIPLLPGQLIELSPSGIKCFQVFSWKEFQKTFPKKSSLNDLKNSLIESIKIRCIGLKKTGIFFSGGIDSTLIAKIVSMYLPKTVLITVGLKHSEDIKNARIVSKELGLELIEKIVLKKEIPFYALKTLKFLGFFDQMQLQIAVPEFIASETAFKNNLRVCFSGQGSDELFCGYSLFKKELLLHGFKGVQKEILNSVSNVWSRNLIRDDLMAMAHSIELRLPFLDQEFLKIALTVPVKQKIFSRKDNIRKHVLRKIALKLGISKKTAFKEKKAIQYGSGLNKELKKLF
jgi:asparagine synthase (glutamine-hydrolysing)